jgi:hypothetical protein
MPPALRQRGILLARRAAKRVRATRRLLPINRYAPKKLAYLRASELGSAPVIDTDDHFPMADWPFPLGSTSKTPPEPMLDSSTSTVVHTSPHLATWLSAATRTAVGRAPKPRQVCSSRRDRSPGARRVAGSCARRHRHARSLNDRYRFWKRSRDLAGRCPIRCNTCERANFSVALLKPRGTAPARAPPTATCSRAGGTRRRPLAPPARPARAGGTRRRPLAPPARPARAGSPWAARRRQRPSARFEPCHDAPSIAAGWRRC